MFSARSAAIGADYPRPGTGRCQECRNRGLYSDGSGADYSAGSGANCGGVLDHLVVPGSDQLPANRPGLRGPRLPPRNVISSCRMVTRAPVLRVSVS
jgi:hypothetical protein